MIVVATLIGSALTFAAPRVLGFSDLPSCGGTTLQLTNEETTSGAMTPDGKFVALVHDNPDGGVENELVRYEIATGATDVAGTGLNDTPVNAAITDAVITPNGRYLAFKSAASNLVVNDTNDYNDVFVHDMQTGTTERVSVTTAGAEAGGATALPEPSVDRPAISADGRYVAFSSTHPALVAPSTTGAHLADVFVRDRQTGLTSRESEATGGAHTADGASYQPSLSEDGQQLAFISNASMFGGSPTAAGKTDVVLRNRTTGVATRMTGPSENSYGVDPIVSGDGSTLAYLASADNSPSDPPRVGLYALVRDIATGVTENASPVFNPEANAGLALTRDGSQLAYVAAVPRPGTEFTDMDALEFDRSDKRTWVANQPGMAQVELQPMTLSADGTKVALFLEGYGAWISPTRIPQITAITANGDVGTGMPHVTATVYGVNLFGSELDLGPGLSVNSYSPASDPVGPAALDFAVAGNAPTGPRYIQSAARGCFTGAHLPLYVVTSVSITGMGPTVVGATPRMYSLAGSGFVEGGSVTIGGVGITASNAHVVDSTRATFTAVATPGLANLARSVTWTNPNGATATCVCISGVNTIAPQVLYIGPSDVAVSEIALVISDDTNEFDLNGSSILVRKNGAPVNFTRRPDPANGLYWLTIPNPSDGTYYVRVTPKDFYGNVGTTITRSVERGQNILTLNAYGSFQGGAETASGDVDGDGLDDIITAAGPGGGPHVRVFKVNPATGATKEAASFMAYDQNFLGGVRVAAVDVDGDGTAEVVTSPGPGGGPHVRIWHVKPTGGVTEVSSFFAYAPDVTVGVAVAGGDLNGDGRQEVITSPSAGAGPHVRAFSINNRAANEMFGFMAYDPGFTGGVRATAADLDGDGVDEIVTGAGPGGGPHVQVFWMGNGAPEVVESFMAYDPGFTGGVTPSAADVDGDGIDELLLSAGGGGGPHVKLLAFDAEGPFEFDGFMAYDQNFHGGVSAAGGDLDGDGDDDVITTPGPGMPVTIVARRVM